MKEFPFKLPVKYTNRAPVFILGVNGSGKHFLTQVLRKYLRFNFDTEFQYFLPLLKKIDSNKFLEKDDNLLLLLHNISDLPCIKNWQKNLDFKYDVNWIMKSLKKRSFYEIMDVIYTRLNSKKNLLRWGFSSTNLLFNVSHIAKFFPEAQFIHLIRDGRDVVAELRKRNNNKGNARDIAEYWKYYLSSVQKYSIQISANRFFIVKYENLESDPEETFSSLIRFLQTDDKNNQIERFIRNNIHTCISGMMQQQTSQSLSKRDRNEFERIAGELLVKYQYKVNLSVNINYKTNYRKQWQVSSFMIEPG